MNTKEHLLVCLGEEGAEIVHITGKCLRFGMNDVNILDLAGPDNRQRLVGELNDLIAVADMLADRRIIPANWQDAKAQQRKKTKLAKFMRYARERKTLFK